MLAKTDLPTNQILALDVGQRRIGVARAHLEARLPQPLAIIKVGRGEEFRQLQTLLDQYRPEIIVIGLPYNTAGQATTQTTWTQTWVAEFQQEVNFKGKIVYQDEVLTSHAARQDLKTATTSNKTSVDDWAACIILSDYLESENA